MAKIKVSEMHDGMRIRLGTARILIKGEPTEPTSDSGNYAVTMLDLDMSPGQKPFTAFLQGHTRFELEV